MKRHTFDGMFNPDPLRHDALHTRVCVSVHIRGLPAYDADLLLELRGCVEQEDVRRWGGIYGRLESAKLPVQFRGIHGGG